MCSFELTVENARVINGFISCRRTPAHTLRHIYTLTLAQLVVDFGKQIEGGQTWTGTGTETGGSPAAAAAAVEEVIA